MSPGQQWTWVISWCLDSFAFLKIKNIYLGIAVCLLITLRFIKVQQSKALFLSIQYELLYCIFSDFFSSHRKALKCCHW